MLFIITRKGKKRKKRGTEEGEKIEGKRRGGNTDQGEARQSTEEKTKERS